MEKGGQRERKWRLLVNMFMLEVPMEETSESVVESAGEY